MQGLVTRYLTLLEDIYIYIIWSLLLIWLFRLSHSSTFFWFPFLSLYTRLYVSYAFIWFCKLCILIVAYVLFRVFCFIVLFCVLFVCKCVDSSRNVMAHGDAREGKWRRNWRMEWVAITLHTTSEHGVSSITTADAHTSAASSRLNWRPCRI